MSYLDLETSGGTLPDTQMLSEALLAAAEAGNFELELERARSSIDRLGHYIDPLELFCYRVLFFDLAMVSTTDQRLQAETAASLLTGAIESGGSAWMEIRASRRIDEIERLALMSDSGIELLELLAYAPDMGMRGFAVNSIELAGMRALDRGEDSRRFERLLHAIGATSDAYRLEAARKQRLAVLHTGYRRTVRRTKPLRNITWSPSREVMPNCAARWHCCCNDTASKPSRFRHPVRQCAASGTSSGFCRGVISPYC